MWISRKRFEALEQELREIDERLKRHEIDVTNERNIRVYRCGHPAIYWGSGELINVSLKEAITKILDHLGLEFKYVRGQPASADLSKKAK